MIFLPESNFPSFRYNQAEYPEWPAFWNFCFLCCVIKQGSNLLAMLEEVNSKRTCLFFLHQDSWTKTFGIICRKNILPRSSYP